MQSAISRRQAAGLLLGGAIRPPARPNIVFILADDLRQDALGVTGHPFSRTPNIDRVAREGVLFHNAFVTTPLCSPSRASFLTGQYVRTHGVINNTRHNELSHQFITWPRLLHEAGYETAFIGKIHMGNDAAPRPGFDRWVSFRGQGHYEDPPLNVDGKDVDAKGYMTDLLNGFAVDFAARKRERPFCLYLAHKAVHGPLTPAPRHKSLYEGQTMRPPATAGDTMEGKPAMVEARRKADARGRSEMIRNQLRCLAAVDEGVGRLMDTLRESGRLDDTVFVFTSDNGLFWGEHSMGDKRASYEESIRIPMMLRYPRLARPGSRSHELVLNIDIGPTMLELSGARVPAGMQGRSMAGLLTGKTGGWRKSFLMEYYDEPRNTRIPSWEGIRSERWKYTRYFERPGMDELYDLQRDPLEMKNLARDPGAASTLRELQAELGKYPKARKA